MIIRLFYKERPLAFYSLLALLCAIATVGQLFLDPDLYGAFILYTFIGFWFFSMCGIFLNGQIKNKREILRLFYLSYPFKNNDDNC